MHKICLFVLAIAGLGFLSPTASAQVPAEWCSPATAADGGQVCASDPATACAMQNDSFNPLGGIIFTQAKARQSLPYDGTEPSNYVCEYERVDFPPGQSALRYPLAGAFLNCPSGTYNDGGVCQPVEAQVVPDMCSSAAVGNPIDVRRGAKLYKVTDWSSSDGRLHVTRQYNSAMAGRYFWSGNNNMMGRGWAVAPIPRIRALGERNPGAVTVFDTDGFAIHFQYFTNEGGFVQRRDVTVGKQYRRYTMTMQPDIPFGDLTQMPTVLTVTGPKGVVHKFQSTPIAGTNPVVVETRPISTLYPDGYEITYGVQTYDVDNIVNGNAKFSVVTSLTDNLGRTLQINYSTWDYLIQPWISEGDRMSVGIRYPRLTWANPVPRLPRPGRISSIVLPDGTSLHYNYDFSRQYSYVFNTRDRLRDVTQLDANGQVIWSENYEYAGGGLVYGNSLSGHLLTGVTDAMGNRIRTFAYDQSNRAIRTEMADGVGRHTVDYRTINDYTREADVTNPLGRVSTYKMRGYQDRENVVSIEGQPSPNCDGDFRQFTYTRIYSVGVSPGSKTDKNGVRTSYSYDSLGQRIRETVGEGTPQAYTTNWTYDPNTRLMLSETTPSLDTQYVRDTRGRITQITQQDRLNTSAAPRVWSLSYSGLNLNPSQVDGPLPGSSDTVDMVWSGERLLSITNSLGHVTQFSNHTAYGLPKTITDPNGVVTSVAYSARNLPTEIIEDVGGLAATTTLVYDLNNNVTNVTLPNGTTFSMVYDANNRLTSLVNGAGESMSLTYNVMNTVTEVTYSDPGGGIAFELQTVTDELNRITKSILPGTSPGLSSETLFAYDKKENVTVFTDPNGSQWQRSFDALDRLVSEIAPDASETQKAYDNRLRPTQALSRVTDPRGAETDYVQSGFNEVVSELSAEAGQITYERDERGLVTRKTDARGQVVDYTYDAAGRLLTESYAGAPTQDVTYTYDTGPNGIGQLTSVTESFGTTTYSYNALGHLVSEVRTINGVSYTTSYTYDLAGNILSTTYPSGITVTAARDGASRISDLTLGGNGSGTTALLSSVSYRRFGPLAGALYGDGTDLTITYDTAYRSTRLSRIGISGAIYDVSFDHDANGNITALNDAVNPDRDQNFTYDPLNRLSVADGGYGVLAYGYGPTGDRLSRDWTDTSGTSVISETYSYVNHRLAEIRRDGALYRSLVYSAAGQMETDTTDGTLMRLVNDARGRLASVEDAVGTVQASYIHDVSELRISKTSSAGTVHYHYDQQGRLIEETDGLTGAVIRSYVWLGLSPVATLGDAATGAPRPLTYLHTDHLGKPVRATDMTGAVVWDGGVITPFGVQIATLGALTQPLLFPGNIRTRKQATPITGTAPMIPTSAATSKATRLG